jgi:hypothetical protein
VHTTSALLDNARGDRKKIRKIKFRNETCSKFEPLCILEQGASLRKYIGAGIGTHLSLFCRFLYLHSFSYLRLPISTSPTQSPSPSPSLSPLPSPSSSPSPFIIKKKNKSKLGANNLLRFAYSWGHCLKIVLYLTESEILKLKTKGKLKDKRTLNSTIRDLYRM